MLCINHKITYHLHIKHIRNHCFHDFNFPNNDLLDLIKTDKFFHIKLHMKVNGNRQCLQKKTQRGYTKFKSRGYSF